jgi:polyhydroxyalkanoate synthesis regulator phasin
MERNRFGVMWRVPKAERERRAKEIADAERRLTNMEKGIANLQAYHYKTRDKIKNANGRIQTLERKVKDINRQRDTARTQIRNMPNTPEVRNATGDVQRLQAQVNALSTALTG